MKGIKMNMQSNKVLSPEEVMIELLSTSDARPFGTYEAFRFFVEENSFTCMEKALCKLYEAGIIDGCVA